MTNTPYDRLTDALAAAARTVPDDLVPPGLPEQNRRHPSRGLLVGLVAAASVAAAALVVPSLASGDTELGVAGSQAPPGCPSPDPVKEIALPRSAPGKAGGGWLDGLPFGTAASLPVTVMKDASGGGYLQDGSLRVPLRAGYQFQAVGRIQCGWIGLSTRTGTNRQRFDAGVLSTSGAFRSFGSAPKQVVLGLSPDGRQVVVVRSTAGKHRLTVLDLADGREIRSTETGAVTGFGGWNTNGIWFSPNLLEARTLLWRPGQEPVAVDGLDGHRIVVQRTTDRMLVVPGAAGQPDCVRVVTLAGANRLAEVMRACGATDGALSHDGSVLQTTGPSGSRGYLVTQNKPTRFVGPPGVFDSDSAGSWEDDEHVLVTLSIPPRFRRVLLRCNVVRGGCLRVHDIPDDEPALLVGER
jgi:hypothetical protein